VVVSDLSALTYLLAVSGMSGLVAPELWSQVADLETWISGGFSISCQNSISGRTSTSGIAAELRPPRVRDLSSEDHGRGGFYTTYVTTGVGSVSRAARIEADSHGRLLRPTLPDDVVSMILLEERHLLDSESTQNLPKFTTLPWRRFYVQNVAWEGACMYSIRICGVGVGSGAGVGRGWAARSLALRANLGSDFKRP